MKKIYCLLICIMIHGIASAQKDGTQTGLIYGTDYAFLLTAPKGWVLDNKAGQPQRLSVVFYPKGESWDSAVTAMYASTWTLQPREKRDDVIKADEKRIIKSDPALYIKQLPDVKLSNNLVAAIREIPRDKQGNYEMIAYIQQRNFMVLIVMTSRNKKDMDKKTPKFYELIKSYQLSSQK